MDRIASQRTLGRSFRSDPYRGSFKAAGSGAGSFRAVNRCASDQGVPVERMETSERDAFNASTYKFLAAEFPEADEDLSRIKEELTALQESDEIPVDLLRRLGFGSVDELMWQRVTTDELLRFLEMGEQRIVDLAVKVKELEDQNDLMLQRKKEKEVRKAALRDEVDMTRLSLKKLYTMYEDRERMFQKMTKQKDDLETVHEMRMRELREQQDEQSREVTQAKQDCDDEKKQKEKTRAEHEALQTNLTKSGKQVDKLQREVNGLTKENAKQEMRYQKLKNDRKLLESKKDEKFKEMKQSKQEDLERLQCDVTAIKDGLRQRELLLEQKAKDLDEKKKKLDKAMDKLKREKEQIRQEICNAVYEIEETRDKELDMLLKVRQQYDKELDEQFVAKKQELEQHWRRMEKKELEAMRQGRQTFEQELRKNEDRVTEGRGRLDQHSDGLDKYGKRLEGRYAKWQKDTKELQQEIDRAWKEKSAMDGETVEMRMKLHSEAQNHVSEIELSERDMIQLEEQYERIGKERMTLRQSTQVAQNEYASLQKQKTVLRGENSRLVDDNSDLEKNFNDLKCERDLLQEELTSARTSAETAHLRKSGMVLFPKYGSQSKAEGYLNNKDRRSPSRDQAGIDVLAFSCQPRQLDDDGAGLLARTRDGRRQLRKVVVKRNATFKDDDEDLVERGLSPGAIELPVPSEDTTRKRMARQDLRDATKDWLSRIPVRGRPRSPLSPRSPRTTRYSPSLAQSGFAPTTGATYATRQTTPYSQSLNVELSSTLNSPHIQLKSPPQKRLHFSY
eukprot:Hpha_TRINITY_DN22100_c0_g1::TRINITY_DN22100_c0_g1_i1::g.103693::m.103693